MQLSWNLTTQPENQPPSRCGSSPIQMMAFSSDMPGDVAFLFQDVGDAIKGIYKANLFQSAHKGYSSELSWDFKSLMMWDLTTEGWFVR